MDAPRLEGALLDAPLLEGALLDAPLLEGLYILRVPFLAGMDIG